MTSSGLNRNSRSFKYTHASVDRIEDHNLTDALSLLSLLVIHVAATK